ncbi:MAG TPA: glycosyl hydrolase family 18 protein [Candidatus Paceibacterota bacterium]|nr:glycosyl hydrolase family 18 protein [Candidatus Paceibacterota bacterium]
MHIRTNQNHLLACIAAAGLVLAVMLIAIIPEAVPAAHAAAPAPGTPVTAWLQKHDWDAGVALVERYADRIGTVSPLWWEAGEDGGTRQVPGAHADDPALRAIAAAHGIALVPLVSDVTASGSQPQRVLATLRDPALRAQSAHALATLAVAHGYDGLDLDYEGIRSPEDLDAYASFIETLARDLHESGKRLSVALEASALGTDTGALARIGAAADTVQIMLYGPGTTAPGPLITPAKAHSLMAEAAAAISAEKLEAGIAVYGVAWQDGARVGTGTWQEYAARASAEKLASTQDPVTGATRYDTGSAALWLPNAASVMRIRLALADLGVSNVALWHVGGMDPQILDALGATR